MEKLEGKTTRDPVVDAKFCIPHPMHLILKPKKGVFQRTIFNVVEYPTGGQLFRIENRDPMANYYEWTILDATGSAVATIRRRIFSSTWRVYRGKNTREEDSLVSVKRQEGLGLNVFLGSTVAKKKRGGDFDVVGFPPTIYKGDMMIADVNNFSWAGDDTVKKGGFKVRVSAGTDHVFIISLILIHREMTKSLSSRSDSTAVVGGGIDIGGAILKGIEIGIDIGGAILSGSDGSSAGTTDGGGGYSGC